MEDRKTWKTAKGWYGYHIDDHKGIVGPFATEYELALGLVKGTSVEDMTRQMLEQGLITDNEGNVLVKP